MMAFRIPHEREETRVEEAMKQDSPELRQAKELANNLVQIGAELDQQARLLKLVERWRLLAKQQAAAPGTYTATAAAMLAVCAKELEQVLGRR
jgi:hypothetical protein